MWLNDEWQLARRKKEEEEDTCWSDKLLICLKAKKGVLGQACTSILLLSYLTYAHLILLLAAVAAAPAPVVLDHLLLLLLLADGHD